MKGSATAALQGLKRQDLLQKCAYVNGAWLSKVETISVVDPAAGEEVAQVAAYVQREAMSAFVEEFAKATSKLKVGQGFEPGVDIGPMTKPSVAEKCRRQVSEALCAGARIVAGGQDSPLGGNFVTPTVLADVTVTC